MKAVALILLLLTTSCASVAYQAQAYTTDTIGLCNYVKSTTITQMDLITKAKNPNKSVSLEYCSDVIDGKEAYIIYSVQTKDQHGKLRHRKDFKVFLKKENTQWVAVKEEPFFQLSEKSEQIKKTQSY